MAALLQWRRFNFFDIKPNIDGGKLGEAVKDASVTCSAAGHGLVYIGDSSGCIHSITRQLKLDSFQAYDQSVNSILAFDHTRIIVTVADGKDGPSEIKVWSPDKTDVQGRPLCLRTIQPDPRPPPTSSGRGSSVPRAERVPKVKAVAVHPNLSLMAIGFADGSVMLYRGEVSRERGSKSRVIATVSGAVTSLHIRHGTRLTHLFVTTQSNIYSINCTARDKESIVELDSVGCKAGCATLADGRHEHHFLVARPDAIYSYTTDSRGSCYVFEGEKTGVYWFKGYLIVAALEKGVPINRSSEYNITIYDLTNKLVSLSTRVQGLAGAVGEWGSLYLITKEPNIIHILEKDLHSKFQILFKKNQFDVAISLAKTQSCDPEEVAEILRQYGDWLYSKGNQSSAMDQYIKTIPQLEPSYVIRKYLDTQHIHNLTTYLQELHKSGATTADHTSLLLNCYTRLRDTQQLNEFIMSKDGAVDCDVEMGVRVCRSAGYYDHALALAAKHNLHHHHLAILIDDKKDYVAALRYISLLEFKEAKDNVLRYGSVLLSHVPDDTTELLISLCTDYKPTNSPIIKEGSLDGYLTPEDPLYADPEDFEYLLVGHSEQAITFLEKMSSIPGKLSAKLYTTLLAEYLHQYGLAPEGQAQAALAAKVMELLRNSDTGYNRDHALLLCDKYHFYDGKLLLWDQAAMYEELLAWYAERGDIENMLSVCSKKSQDKPALWCSALKMLTSPSSVLPPDPQHLMTCLSKIEENRLLPPLEVVDQLSTSPNITLGHVRDYLLRVVSTYTSTLAEETKRAKEYASETSKMRDTINSIRTSAVQFTATKCRICNNELELPSVHFLCMHSFHQHCFESYSENDVDCPICLPETRKMLDVIKDQETHRSQHDQFHEHLERATDSFSVVADYLGRGVFTQPQSLAAMFPSLNTTKAMKNAPAKTPTIVVDHDVSDSGDISRSRSNSNMNSRSRSNSNMNSRSRSNSNINDQNPVPEAEGRIRALERNNQGPVGVGGEGRLRMGERRGQGIIESEPENRTRFEGRVGGRGRAPDSGHAEGRVRQDTASKVLTSPTEGQVRMGISSNVTVPTPESRIRSTDALKMGGSSRYSPSLHDHITASPATSHERRSNPSPVESISSNLANVTLSQSRAEETSRSNPFGEDFETEQMGTNPFEEDYDESKNPFSDDSPKRSSSDEPNPFSESSDNPFSKDDYDTKLNPFGES